MEMLPQDKDEEKTSQFSDELKKLQIGQNCFDCKYNQPDCASVYNGIFICTNCAKTHRGISDNISLVKTISNDEWIDREIQMMVKGGNTNLKEFLDFYDLNNDPQ